MLCETTAHPLSIPLLLLQLDLVIYISAAEEEVKISCLSEPPLSCSLFVLANLSHPNARFLLALSFVTLPLLLIYIAGVALIVFFLFHLLVLPIQFSFSFFLVTSVREFTCKILSET